MIDSDHFWRRKLTLKVRWFCIQFRIPLGLGKLTTDIAILAICFRSCAKYNQLTSDWSVSYGRESLDIAATTTMLGEGSKCRERLMTRVDMVGTNHDELLTQLSKAYTNGSIWRQYFFDRNYFQVSTTYGPQKFSKIRVLKVNYFHLPIHLANELWNLGSISIQKLICIPDNMI